MDYLSKGKEKIRDSIDFRKSIDKRSSKGELTSLLKKTTLPQTTILAPNSETELNLYDSDTPGPRPMFININETSAKRPSVHYLPNPSSVPTKSIMKKNIGIPEQKEPIETTYKTVRWIDSNEDPEPLHTEHHIPNWDRKSPFVQTTLWKSVMTRDNLKRQKYCVWVVVCIITTICIGFIVILILILKFEQQPPSPHHIEPAPAPLELYLHN